ncbi:MAG: class I SAM-dependent methyltransferase [Streptosporangiaceae bacterium]
MTAGTSSVVERFGTVAEPYDRGRPPYPDELYAALECLTGIRLAGAMVADVGAGTGIATRGLLARGARVVAVEPGARMVKLLRAHDPSTAAIRGNGNALPLRDSAVDIVAYAQAWHWVDPYQGLLEARRVLKGGGALAAWWNVPDRSATWLAEHERRVAASCPERAARRSAPLEKMAPAHGFQVRTARTRWSRTIPLAVFLASVRSTSYVAALRPREADALIAEERDRLEAVFPGGEVTEPLVTGVVVARKVG